MRAASVLLLLAAALLQGTVADDTTSGWTTVTAPTTTNTPSTPLPTTTGAPSTPTLAPVNEFNRCGATNSKLWLDVMFLVDTSSAMGQRGTQDVAAYIQGLLYQTTLGEGPQQLRAGLVTYADKGAVNNYLGAYKTFDDVDNIVIQYSGASATNLEDAISQAKSQFDSRPVVNRAARQVMVVIASTYRKGSYNDPNLIANGFKDSGGAIITLEFVQADGIPDPTLAEISSPGFNFTNRDATFTAENMLTAMTHANCFCQTQLRGYTDQVDQTPDGGCVDPVTLPTVFRAANLNCKRKQFTMTKITSDAKQSFIASQFPPKTKIWIGLQNVGGVYTWSSDNTPLTGYTAWGPGQPNRAAGDCVYLQQYSGFKYAWFSDDCMRGSYDYACETDPCSTDRYCYPSS